MDNDGPVLLVMWQNSILTRLTSGIGAIVMSLFAIDPDALRHIVMWKHRANITMAGHL